jgi:hypothetical protein
LGYDPRRPSPAQAWPGRILVPSRVKFYTAKVNKMSIATKAAESRSARLYGARMGLGLLGLASFCSVSSHRSTRLRFLAKSYCP